MKVDKIGKLQKKLVEQLEDGKEEEAAETRKELLKLLTDVYTSIGE